MSVLVSNLQEEIAVDNALTDFCITAVEATLRCAGYGDEAEVGLVFVNDSYIHELNLHYRAIDSPTDVLSFSMLEGEPFPEAGGATVLLGDIVISLQTAERQAEEYGHSFQREVAYLTIHGTLHLLGYDHMNEEDRQLMRRKEEEILRQLNIL